MKRPRGPAPKDYSWDGERGWVDAAGVVRPEATRNDRRVQQRNASAEQLQRHKDKYQLYDSGGRLWQRKHPEAVAAMAHNMELQRRASERYEAMTAPARQRRDAWLAAATRTAGSFTGRQLRDFCCGLQGGRICHRVGRCVCGYQTCTVLIGDCFSDGIHRGMDEYEVSFPDAPPGSLGDRDPLLQRLSVSMIGAALGVPRLAPPAPGRYELEREQAEEEAVREDY